MTNSPFVVQAEDACKAETGNDNFLVRISAPRESDGNDGPRFRIVRWGGVDPIWGLRLFLAMKANVHIVHTCETNFEY